MTKEMDEKMKEIQAIENKYGLMLFRMGLTHLVDAGVSSFDDNSVEEGIKQIVAQGEADEANGVKPIMTAEFKCEIMRCSAELSYFSIWTLFRYIKEYVVVDN